MDEEKISRRIESSLSQKELKEEKEKTGDELEEKNLLVCCPGERRKIWDEEEYGKIC